MLISSCFYTFCCDCLHHHRITYHSSHPCRRRHRHRRCWCCRRHRLALRTRARSGSRLIAAAKVAFSITKRKTESKMWKTHAEKWYSTKSVVYVVVVVLIASHTIRCMPTKYPKTETAVCTVTTIYVYYCGVQWYVCVDHKLGARTYLCLPLVYCQLWWTKSRHEKKMVNKSKNCR